MQDLRNTARRRAVPLFLFCAFCLVWGYTTLTPLIADDFNYAFSYAIDVRLDSLWSILFSLNAHYRFINGRLLSHFFAMLFLTVPKGVFNLANALVFTLGLGLQGRFLRVWGRERLLPLAAALLWLCLPVYGQVFFWLDGACNYSWGLTLALAVLLPFYRAACGDAPCWPLWKKLAFLPLCFASGAYSEHISLSLLAAAFFLLLLRSLTEKRAARYPLLAFCVLALGYLSLMLSPTMRLMLKRLLQSGALAALLPKLLALLFSAALALLLALRLLRRLAANGRWRPLCRVLRALVALGWSGAAPVLGWRAFSSAASPLAGLAAWLSSTALGVLSALALLAFSLLSALLRGTERRRLLSAALLGLGGLCSLLLFPLSNYFPARASASLVLFAILASLSLLEPPARPAPRRVLAALFALLFLLSFTLGTADIVRLHGQAVERERIIREELAAGSDTVALRPYTCSTKYAALYGLPDLEPPEAEWPRDRIGIYYGIAHLISLPRE